MLELDAHVVVIYHATDMDGWTSASIVRRYLPNPENAVFIGYNYSNKELIIDKVHEAIQEHGKVYIFMVDCTIMEIIEEHPDWVISIDHHKSVLETQKFKNYKDLMYCCTSSVMGYPSEEYQHPVQISACELTWQTLFPGEEMPLFVRLAGRYDVWDKKDPRVDEFNAFIRNPGKFPVTKEIFMEPWFDKLYDDDFVNDICLPRGRQVLEYQKETWAIEAKISVTRYWHKHNGQIAVVNRGLINSSFFESTCRDHPCVDVVSCYTHRIKNSIFSISFFSVGQKEITALRLMREFLANLPNDVVMTSGGHEHACGCSIKDTDIWRYRQWLEQGNRHLVK